MQDKLGTEIKIGCWIAYSVLVSKSAVMKIAKVVDIKEKKISVQSIVEKWNGQLALSQKSSLTSMNRIIVLDRDKVPEIYKQMIGEDSFKEAIKEAIEGQENK